MDRNAGQSRVEMVVYHPSNLQMPDINRFFSPSTIKVYARFALTAFLDVTIGVQSVA